MADLTGTNWLDWAAGQAENMGLNAALAKEILRLKEEGFDGESLVLELRQTAPYKARFPAMAEMIQKAGWDESNYIKYENAMKMYEVDYGLPTGFLSSTDQVAKMATQMLDEEQIKQRILVNRAAANDVPQEVKTALQQYYGVSDSIGALTSYYLDPTRSLQTLQAELETARIGGAAARYQFQVDEATARGYRLQGVSAEQASTGYQQARQMEALTKGLSPDQMVTEDTLVAAQFGDTAAADAVRREAGARTASFQGGGGAATGNTGATGLGSSTG